MHETSDSSQPAETDFDAYLRQVQERKARFIYQVTQDGPVDTDSSYLTYAEIKALATGAQVGE